MICVYIFGAILEAIFKIVVHKELLDEWNLGQYLNVLSSGILT